MIKVRNQKVISNLAYKSFLSNKVRNIIAVLAIALTTLLFTSLFSITGTIINSYQQATFRQVGGDFHGSFKDITKEELDILAKDSLIKEAGSRLVLGMPGDIPFNKAHVEVSYMDAFCAKSSFCTPEYGNLPREGTNEMACDTRVLTLLGIEPEIGQTITLTYKIGTKSDSSIEVTDTFTLSGWWTYDSASYASHIIVPLSYANSTLLNYEKIDEADTTGTWTLNVFLNSATHIEEDLKAILQKNGYQSDDSNAANYIAIGVNWGYMGAQLSNTMDAGTLIAIIVLLLLITLTGYLIIYNIFQISVSNDIRFYGLLKTIGTTKKQIKRLILRQAFILSVLGIPIGLILGYVCGNLLTPYIMTTLSYQTAHASANPLIFAGAITFSMITVLLSCNKPGKLASKVSPMEAIRYFEGSNTKRKAKHTKQFSLLQMAFYNLTRNTKKTVLVVISLSLAVVLFQITVLFSNGFDMEKYLKHFVVSDFILADASYFQTSMFKSMSLTEDAIQRISKEGNIKNEGRIFIPSVTVKEFISKDWYYQLHKKYYDDDSITQMLNEEETRNDGKVLGGTQIYGMEEYALSHINLVEGDLSPLNDPTKKAIAVVYSTDDYGNVKPNSHWAKLGDEVTLRYVDEWEYYNLETGDVLENVDENSPSYGMRASKYHEEDYTVAALVTIPTSMSYRYYSADGFVLNNKVLEKDNPNTILMSYLFDTDKETNDAMNTFLSDYTEHIDPTLDYESKQSYISEFKEFKNMFLLMGSVLSSVIGIVGILNFFNAILTSIMTRKREFAMLQSIGMTAKQLKQMLILEGLFYTFFVFISSLLLSLLAGPLFDNVLGGMFWFFTYRPTLFPIFCVTPIFLLLGILLPILSYRFSANHTIVERLREVE